MVNLTKYRFYDNIFKTGNVTRMYLNTQYYFNFHTKRNKYLTNMDWYLFISLYIY